MPDIWTHIIAGKDIASDINNPWWQQQIKENINLFRFGCQGPDFFLYYNFWPWKKDKRGCYYGDIIHTHRCGDFYQEIIKYIKHNTRPETSIPLTVYLLGLICHWAVDRTAHPYIHYISGINNRHNHKRIEAAIDSIMASNKMKLDVTKEPVKPHLYLGPKLPQYITQLYQQILPKLYPDAPVEPTPGIIDKSYNDMMRALDIFHDPYGYKKKFFGIYDMVTRNSINARAYFYRHVEQLKTDYLNLSHKEWCHPCDQNECSNQSFLDLLDIAHRDGVKLIDVALNFLYNREINDNCLSKTFLNISFSTGKSTSDDRSLIYCRPILD